MSIASVLSCEQKRSQRTDVGGMERHELLLGGEGGDRSGTHRNDDAAVGLDGWDKHHVRSEQG